MLCGQGLAVGPWALHTTFGRPCLVVPVQLFYRQKVHLRDSETVIDGIHLLPIMLGG